MAPNTVGADDYFGFNVAASDEFFVVGTWFNNAVYMYDSRGNLDRTITDPSNTDSFGFDVAICNGIIVIGSDNGAYLYYTNTGTLVDLPDTVGAKILDVDCSEDTFVVGSHEENNSKGAVYIYDTRGTLVNTIVAPNQSSSQEFGASLAVSAGRVAVHGREDNISKVFIFTTSGTFEREMQPPVDPGDTLYVGSLAIYDDLVVDGHAGANSGSGEAHIFSATTGVLIGSVVAPDASPFSFFGFGVAITNETIFIGAPGDNAFTGAVYTFLTDGTYVNKIISPNPEVGGNFGSSIAISGESGIIGSQGINGNTGAAYIYLSYLEIMAPNTVGADDYFGFNVAASDEFFVVGTWFNNAVYMYDSRGNLDRTITDPSNTDSFGFDVAICNEIIVIGSGNGAYLYNTNDGALVNLPDTVGAEIWDVDCSEDTFVVGSPNENNSKGAVYIYDTSGTLVNTIVAPNQSSSSFFGYSVAVSAGRVAVNGIEDDFSKVYIFTTDGSYERELQPPVGQNDATYFGSLAIYDDLVVDGHAGANSDTGEAHIFSATTGVLIASVVAPDASPNSGFGYSVSITNGKIFIGADGDNASTGAVYTFLTDGTYVNKIISPNPEVGGCFGSSIAISGESGIIGSDCVNGNKGAAYIYPRL